MTNLAAKPQTAREYLAAGEAAFAKGDRSAGSRLLERAVASTFRDLAAKHGLDPDESLSAIARALDAKAGGGWYYLGHKGYGVSMKHNADLDYMDSEHLEMAIGGIRQFVNEHA